MSHYKSNVRDQVFNLFEVLDPSGQFRRFTGKAPEDWYNQRLARGWTIGMAQESVDFDGADVVLEAKGRHDPCVVPRAVPIVESMAALVLIDMALQQRARQASSPT